MDVLLLLMTSSPCPAELHGTRLSTKIKTEGPYFSQHQGVLPVAFTQAGGAGGGMSRSVLLSIQRHIAQRFIYLLSPSPNLQSWEQEPSGWVISVAEQSRARLWGVQLLGMKCIGLTECSQKAQLCWGWRERFVLGIPASLQALWMDPELSPIC